MRFRGLLNVFRRVGGLEDSYIAIQDDNIDLAPYSVFRRGEVLDLLEK